MLEDPFETSDISNENPEKVNEMKSQLNDIVRSFALIMYSTISQGTVKTFDDLGYDDLSSYGYPIIQTPNLDRLAEYGIKYISYNTF